MRLRIFQSREGDALVLSHDSQTAQGPIWTHVMIDGGRSASYEESMRDALAALEPSHDGAGAPSVDLLVISHIDRDHIEGALQYADDLVDWRVHDFHLKNSAASVAEQVRPDFTRPPAPVQVWHNSFDNLLDEPGVAGDGLSTQVSSVIASLASRFDPPANVESTDAGSDPTSTAAAAVHSLEAGEKQAHHLTERLGADQLNIPMNVPSGGKLMRVGSVPATIGVGSLRFRVLGPTTDELEALEREWRTWLTTAQTALDEIANRSAEVERDLGHPELDAAAAQLHAESAPLTDAEVLRDLAIAAGVSADEATALGRAGKVTWPNRASLMLLAEAGAGDDTRRMVLTGDGHHARVLTGLEQAGVLAPGGSAHVDVLKIPHHGSEHNADAAFFRRLIADHYVVCGDGSHHNPDLAILDALMQSRLGGVGQRSEHPRTGERFTVWFSTQPGHPSLATRTVATEHLPMARARVERWSDEHPGAFEAKWSDGHFIDLELDTAAGGAPAAVGRVFISRALPNPAGGDTGGEWVELTNDGAASIALDDLRLEDRQGGAHPLSGSLAAGETRRVTFPAGSPVRLANSADDVVLLRGSDELHRVTWTNAASGDELPFAAP